MCLDHLRLFPVSPPTPDRSRASPTRCSNTPAVVTSSYETAHVRCEAPLLLRHGFSQVRATAPVHGETSDVRVDRWRGPVPRAVDLAPVRSGSAAPPTGASRMRLTSR